MSRAALAAAVLLAALAEAPAGAQGTVEAQLMKMEVDRAAAVVKGDVAAIEAMTSDDYMLINANGQWSDKAATMNDIKTGRIKLTANEISDMKVRVYGDTAVVTGKSTATGTMGGRAVKGPLMFTRVYVKMKGQWKSVAFQQTPILP
jgi:ketosteroid isomerase-like protein